MDGPSEICNFKVSLQAQVNYLAVTILHKMINEVDRKDDKEFDPELLKVTCH